MCPSLPAMERSVVWDAADPLQVLRDARCLAPTLTLTLTSERWGDSPALCALGGARWSWRARRQALVIVSDLSLFHSHPAFAAFLLVAGLLDFQRALALFVLTGVVLAFLAHSLLKRLLGPKLLRCFKPLGHCRLNVWFER